MHSNHSINPAMPPIASRRCARISVLTFFAVSAAAYAADVTSTWASATSGFWNVNANWINVPALGGFPHNGNGEVATYDAVIAAAGAAYTITLNSAVTVEDLLLSSADATLHHTGNFLTATNGIVIDAGTYQLSGGTIRNTVISTSGSGVFAFTSNGGTFSDGTVFNGALNLLANNAQVRLLSGATFTGPANLNGTGATLRVEQTTTLTGKAIQMNGWGARLAVGGFQTVTLDPGTVVRGRGFLSSVSSFDPATLVNQGAIRADLAGETLTIGTDVFTNSTGGLVEAVNGSILTIAAPFQEWTNAGQITAAGSSTVNLRETWTNTGTIAVQAGSTLNIGGGSTVLVAGGTLAGLGRIVNSPGGTVNITGTLTNTAAGNLPLDVTAGTWVLDGGTIRGGRIVAGSAGQTLTFTATGGILSDGLVFEGDLELAQESAKVELRSGATFTGAARLTGEASSLVFADSQTLSGKTLHLDGFGAELGVDGTLTLDAGALLRGRGSAGGQAIINQGTIRADIEGVELLLNTGSFSQAGTIEAVNGATLTVSGGYTQTAGVTRVDGGTILSGSIILVGGSLEGNGTIRSAVANSATISPGLSVGALAIEGDLSLTGSSVIRIELGGTVPGTQYDLLSEAGTVPLTLGGTLEVLFLEGFQNSVQAGDTFTIISSNQAITGAFENLAGGRVATSDGSGFFDVEVSGNSVILSNFVVPEPTVAGLILAGLAQSLARRRRRYL